MLSGFFITNPTCVFSLRMFLFDHTLQECIQGILLSFVHIFTALYITLGEAFTMLFPSLQVKGKAVLVTGCDCGFGHALAKHLHKLGFTVFAGCLLKVWIRCKASAPLDATTPMKFRIFNIWTRGRSQVHSLQLHVPSERD